jgi:ribosomal protein L2
MNGLFHRDVFLPPELITKACNRFKLTFSKHAREACRNDKYGIIIPPTSINPKPEQIIEVEVVNGNVVKVVARINHDSRRDLMIAYIPEENGVAFVKTLWFNLTSDNHRTLDKSRYVKP